MDAVAALGHVEVRRRGSTVREARILHEEHAQARSSRRRPMRSTPETMGSPEATARREGAARRATSSAPKGSAPPDVKREAEINASRRSRRGDRSAGAARAGGEHASRADAQEVAAGRAGFSSSARQLGRELANARRPVSLALSHYPPPPRRGRIPVSVGAATRAWTSTRRAQNLICFSRGAPGARPEVGGKIDYAADSYARRALESRSKARAACRPGRSRPRARPPRPSASRRRARERAQSASRARP